jgi:formyltetrahydrofolate deformylase
VAAVTDFLSRHNGNILQLDQHVDTQENVFFMRVEWDLANFQIKREDIATRFSAVATPFEMTWQLHFSDQIPRMAIFVSKEAHCLYDILYRHQSGEWQVEIRSSSVTIPIWAIWQPSLAFPTASFRSVRIPKLKPSKRNWRC